MKISDIQMRDPFVYREGNSQYLFGSTDKDIWRSAGVGFDMYKSDGSLSEFEGPFPAFRPPPDFWSLKNFWAPEVYKYRGEYFMFATFLPREGCRGTAILKCAGSKDGGGQLPGPFVPWSDGPVTPVAWECLDGTFYADGEGNPWMIFCHEWTQVVDGEICLIPLSGDLKKAAGEPELLFRASEAPWSSPLKNRPVPGYVTDGPNMYTASNGDLLMLWSSFGADGKYCIGIAKSESGHIKGPWKQADKPLYSADGGHGMLFHAVDGKLYLTVHTPNQTPRERPIFIEMTEQDGMVYAGERIIS